MKNKLLLILALLLSLNALGQLRSKIHGSMYRGKYSNKDFFNKSDYIFEGEVISNKFYLSEDSTHVFTSSKIRVVHTYKGEINSNIIEFVRDGGHYKIKDSKRDYTLRDYYKGYLKFRHGRIILFAKKRNGRSFEKDIKIKLEPLDNKNYAAIYSADPYIFTFKMYGFDQLYFNSIDEFHNYAKKQMNWRNKDKFILPKKEEKKKIIKDTTKFENPELDAFMKRQFELLEIAKKNRKKREEAEKKKNDKKTNSN